MSRKTRKLIWSVPLVATLAIVGALALFMTLTSNEAAAQSEEEVPGVPMNLTATGLDPTSIELSWEPPADGDGGSLDSYRIDYSSDNMVWYSLNPTYDSTLYTDDDGLSANEKRYYRVFAVNSTGTSDVLGPKMGTTLTSTVPDAVEDLRASVGANAQKDPPVDADSIDPAPPAEFPQNKIRLVWTPSDDPEGAPVTSYRIQRSTDGRSGWRNLATKSAKDLGCAGQTGECEYIHEYLIGTTDNLLESTDRWYRIYAINKIDESDGSNAPKGSTGLGVAPGPVGAVRAGLNPAGKIYLYWDPPIDDTTTAGVDDSDPPGAPVLGYYIQGKRGTATVAFDDDADEAPNKANLVYVQANTDIPITATLQEKMDPDGTGTFWRFRVIASNRVVDRNLLDGTLDIDGTDPDDANVADTSELEFNAVAQNDDEATLDRAEDGTVATTSDELFDAPELKVSRDTNNVGGRISLILSWKVDGAVPADATGATTYRVEHSEDLVDWEVLSTDGTDVANVFEEMTDDRGFMRAKHIGLVAGTTHHYRIFATHPRRQPTLTAGVFTEASRNVEGTTTGADKPDPPTLDDPSGTSETVITMTWAPPGTVTEIIPSTDPMTYRNPAGTDPVGYGMITGYLVETSADGTTWTDLVTVGPKLDKTYVYDNKTGKLTEKSGGVANKVDFEHTKLYQDQTVHYRISTINNASARSQMSDTSFAKSATTKKAQASDDPGGLVVKARSSTSVMLMWNARADDINAAPITGYKIDSSPLNAAGDDCAEDWTTLVEDTMSTTTAYPHSSLDVETGMCYRVFGINVVATSTSFVGYGDAYITTNDNDAIAMTSERMNTAPTAGAAIADRTVMVDATVMVRSTITDADTLTWSAMSNMPTRATATVDDMGMVTITGVAEGMATITVTATDSAGESATQTIMVTVEAADTDTSLQDIPDSSISVSNNANSSITVSWTGGDNADSFIVVAAELGSDPFTYERANVAGDAAKMTTITGLNGGSSYIIIVIALQGTSFQYGVLPSVTAN